MPKKITLLCLAHGLWVILGNCENLMSMLLITVDRWMSIEFPHIHKSKMNKTIVWRLIVASWIFSVIAASVIIFSKDTCIVHDSTPSTFGIITLVLCFVTVVICYGRIFIITLRTGKSKRKGIKFKLAKTMGMYNLSSTFEVFGNSFLTSKCS